MSLGAVSCHALLESQDLLGAKPLLVAQRAEHLDLIEGKVWVQRDETEDGVTHELVEAGIPKQDIVLGFYPADVRPYTGYAIV
jgi:XisI protein